MQQDLKLSDVVVMVQGDMGCPNCMNDKGICTGLVCTGYHKDGSPKLEPCELCKGTTRVSKKDLEALQAGQQMF